MEKVPTSTRILTSSHKTLNDMNDPRDTGPTPEFMDAELRKVEEPSWEAHVKDWLRQIDDPLKFVDDYPNAKAQDRQREKILKFILSRQIAEAYKQGYAEGCSNPNYNDGFEEGRTSMKEAIWKWLHGFAAKYSIDRPIPPSELRKELGEVLDTDKS